MSKHNNSGSWPRNNFQSNNSQTNYQKPQHDVNPGENSVLENDDVVMETLTETVNGLTPSSVTIDEFENLPPEENTEPKQDEDPKNPEPSDVAIGYNYAVLQNCSSVHIRELPDPLSDIVGIIRLNQRVRVGRLDQEWTEVRDFGPNKLSGFVKSMFLKKD